MKNKVDQVPGPGQYDTKIESITKKSGYSFFKQVPKEEN